MIAFFLKRFSQFLCSFICELTGAWLSLVNIAMEPHSCTLNEGMIAQRYSLPTISGVTSNVVVAWKARGSWSYRPTLPHTTEASHRRAGQQEDLMFIPDYFTSLLLSGFWTLNKVSEINKAVRCNYCFLGILKSCWQKIIFILFPNV